MLGRYIKSQIMVLICGGLVGPIFLAVYFATGQSGLLKWMFWVGPSRHRRGRADRTGAGELRRKVGRQNAGP